MRNEYPLDLKKNEHIRVRARELFAADHAESVEFLDANLATKEMYLSRAQAEVDAANRADAKLRLRAGNDPVGVAAEALFNHWQRSASESSKIYWDDASEHLRGVFTAKAEAVTAALYLTDRD